MHWFHSCVGVGREIFVNTAVNISYRLKIADASFNSVQLTFEMEMNDPYTYWEVRNWIIAELIMQNRIGGVFKKYRTLFFPV
jgi:hypothetical protein